jgi:hypothetical protein
VLRTPQTRTSCSLVEPRDPRAPHHHSKARLDLSTALRFLVPLGAAGGAVSGTVPNDPALAGVSVDLQALEYDAAVPHKLSFTPGLELRFGY